MEKLMEKRAGNMILRHEKDEELEYIVVKTAAGQFEARFRNDMMMFVVMKELMEQDNESVYGSLAHMWFMVCSTMPDLKFMEDLTAAVEGAVERYVEFEGKEYSEEEEQKAIDDVEMVESIQEELENAGEEHN